MQTDRELDAIKAVAGVMIAKSTAIPTPRQLKKDPDVDYSEVMLVLGGYEKAIKKAQAYLDEQGYELVSYDGVRKKKKRTKITDSPQGNRSSRQSVDKTPIKPTYTDEELMDHLVRLYEEGDLSYEDICIYGMTAEEVIMRFEPSGILDRFKAFVENEYQRRLTEKLKEEEDMAGMENDKQVVEDNTVEGVISKTAKDDITKDTTTEAVEDIIVDIASEEISGPIVDAIPTSNSDEDAKLDERVEAPSSIKSGEVRPTKEASAKDITWTKEKCKEAVLKFLDKYGEYPKHRHFRQSTKYDLPSTCTIRNRFGSVKAFTKEVMDISSTIAVRMKGDEDMDTKETLAEETKETTIEKATREANSDDESTKQEMVAPTIVSVPAVKQQPSAESTSELVATTSGKSSFSLKLKIPVPGFGEISLSIKTMPD